MHDRYLDVCVHAGYVLNGRFVRLVDVDEYQNDLILHELSCIGSQNIFLIYILTSPPKEISSTGLLQDGRTLVRCWKC